MAAVPLWACCIWGPRACAAPTFPRAWAVTCAQAGRVRHGRLHESQTCAGVGWRPARRFQALRLPIGCPELMLAPTCRQTWPGTDGTEAFKELLSARAGAHCMARSCMQCARCRLQCCDLLCAHVDAGFVNSYAQHLAWASWCVLCVGLEGCQPGLADLLASHLAAPQPHAAPKAICSSAAWLGSAL